jgi:phage-related protein
LDELSLKVVKKIYWTIDLIRHTRSIPESYLKSIEGTDGLLEIRVIFGGDIYRIFCFFDEGKLVVLANGFQKKTQKTPKREIERALRIKDEYYAEKQKH